MCKNINKRAKWCKAFAQALKNNLFKLHHQNKLRKTTQARRNLLYITFTNAPSKFKNSPSDFHHLGLTVIRNVIFPNMFDGRRSCGKYWCIVRHWNIFRKVILWSGQWTFWPSNKRRNSSHWNSSRLHLRLLIRIISASSEPTHANLPRAGLQNVLKMSHKGCSRKVFPQFVGPISKMFLKVPLPFENRVLRAAVKAFGCILFLFSYYVAELNQRPSSQPGVHIWVVVS